MTAELTWHPSEAAAGLILDLGSNHGEFALAAARLNPGLDVLAIEPIPSLAAAIEAQAQAEGLAKLRCLVVAIDEVAGEAMLNVQSSYDQGVSSLLAFDQHSLQTDEYWRVRADLAFDAAVPVSVRRVDDVLPADPPPIRFVKIDVQGRDLEALRSFGRHLDRIDGGMLEIPGTLASRLYQAETVDLGGAIAELRGMGFEIYAVKPNDPAGNEYNLFFHRRGSDWRRMEEQLGLRRIPLYGGKHFWHMPSDQLRQPEAELATLSASVTAAEGRLAACQAQVRDVEASLAAVTDSVNTTRQDAADALSCADDLRRANAELQVRLAAANETLRLQQQRCEMLLLEAASRRNGATDLARSSPDRPEQRKS